MQVTVILVTINMRFYNRENELKLLNKASALSERVSQMTVVVGRRRIGKTSLLLRAFDKPEVLYFFIAKKSEILLCEEFTEQIRYKLAIPVFGKIKSFKDIFGLLLESARNRHITLIIDEFQEFSTVNASVFSDIQNLWDRYKGQSKMHLILCGSVYSMMTKIFEQSGEPLFGRATQKIHLQSFDINTLKHILSDYAPHCSNEDMLAFYMFTGGVAKYAELLVDAGAFTLDDMIEEIVSENSLFLDEGKNILIEEFGKEYGNYFSILSLIASGKTSRVEIESVIEMQTGGFLDRLENEYRLIKKVRPILAKPNSRFVKYQIDDNFLRFWFRFIYKYRTAIEAGNIAYIKTIFRRDYAAFSGLILEKYFVEKLKSTRIYNLIGTYWDRKNQNEIDIVAVDDIRKTVLFAEVKRQASHISIHQLEQKAKHLTAQFNGYKMEFTGFSLEEM